jgi:hypothetical protein
MQGRHGKFRVITKCRAGFLTIRELNYAENEHYSIHPASVLTGWKKGALQTVEFQADGTTSWLTVFARVGKKIHVVDEEILRTLDIGTINQLWYNTELYSQHQYAAVGAKTWADLAYVRKEDIPQVNQIINQINK